MRTVTKNKNEKKNRKAKHNAYRRKKIQKVLLYPLITISIRNYGFDALGTTKLHRKRH